MKKSDLILEIRKLYPFLTADQVANLIDIIFNKLTESLALGKRIEIRGFGSMVTRKRKVQSKFLKSSKDNIAFEEKNVVYFRMGKEFLNLLNPSQ